MQLLWKDAARVWLCVVCVVACPIVLLSPAEAVVRDNSWYLHEPLHNETCTPLIRPCTNGLNLECYPTDGSGRCRCNPRFTYVYGRCREISTPKNNVCTFDAQCRAGSWGQHAMCNRTNGKCQCMDSWGGILGNPKLLGGVCFVHKYIGSSCNADKECSVFIQGEVYCKPLSYPLWPYNYKGFCQCAAKSFSNQDETICATYAKRFGDTCYLDEHCQLGSLGNLSKCEMYYGRCKCYSPDGPTIYNHKNHRCYKLIGYNETCDDIHECRASLGPRVECDFTEGFPDTKVCHCPDGIVCRSEAVSSKLIFEWPRHIPLFIFGYFFAFLLTFSDA